MSFRDLALETRKVNSMAKLQDAVADACERDLPASEQDRLGELVMQVIEADGGWGIANGTVSEDPQKDWWD